MLTPLRELIGLSNAEFSREELGEECVA